MDKVYNMLTNAVTSAKKLCSTNKNVLPLNVVNDLNCKLNNLLDDFSHCDSKTLSVLFRTYCMKV